MDNQEFRKLLHQLHDEIERTSTVTEKDREKLRHLNGDIRDLLKRSGETVEPVHPSVIQRLEDTIRHFEVDNPELTILISKVLDSLNSAGI